MSLCAEHAQFQVRNGGYSHGEVGDEGSFGHLHVEHDGLRLWGVVHQFALDHGVGHARRDRGPDFVAIKSHWIDVFL